MLRVDYPAKPSYFCGENAIIRTYRRWTTLKCFFTHPCYPYPVVYTDGLLSFVVSDGVDRTPWGIAIGDYIIAINAPKTAMPFFEARKSSKKVVFAGRHAEFVDIDMLRYIRRNIRIFNKMLNKLGGTPFYAGIYPAAIAYDKIPRGIDFAGGPGALLEVDDKQMVYCRPAINISDLY